MELLSTYATSKKYDPTQTTSLRNAFARDMKRRFVELKRVIRIAVVEQDCFGYAKKEVSTFQLVPPGNQAFSFLRDPQKLEAFMRWLNLQVERGLLSLGALKQIGIGIEGAWTDKYILDSYKRGIMRARYELQRAGYVLPVMDIDAIMGLPMHLDRVGILFTRVYSELQGITGAMDSTISQILAQGMIDGDGPRLIARKLIAGIDGVGAGTLGVTDSLGRFIPAERRALMLARTEIIRAFHLATIQEYRNWRVEGVYVMAEWNTAGDDRVCSECDKMQGKRFTLDEIEGMIPKHPHCRCAALPYLAELEPYYKKK
jgi:SPP1 gp7 family putative phage head morphogenesis protein